MLQEEYYVIERANNDNYPLFSWDQSRGDYGLGRPVEFHEPIKLRLGEPISPNFEWVDYHAFPTNPVVSKIVVDVLAPFDLQGVQFVPAKVRNSRDPFSEPRDYWFIHVWNRIACLDKTNTELELYDDGSIFGIDKLVLNEKTLLMFELRKRLMFELTENTSVLLIHQRIKTAIESVHPKGCRFFKVAEWNSDKTFEK